MAHRSARRSCLPFGLAVALVVNGTALLILARAGKGLPEAPHSAGMEFRLIRLAPPQPRPRRPRVSEAEQPAAPLARPLSAPAFSPGRTEAAAQPAATASAAAGGPATTAPSDLGRIFRTNLGCSDPKGLRLTAEERARCAARLGDGARQAAVIPAPMDSGKRAWFDAAHAAYNPKDRMDGNLPVPIGCKVSFGGPKKTFKPAHSLKIPGLPCYLIPPRGVLTEESAIAPPEHVETR